MKCNPRLIPTSNPQVCLQVEVSFLQILPFHTTIANLFTNKLADILANYILY